MAVTAHSDSVVASQVLGRAPAASFLLCLSATAAAAQIEARRMNFVVDLGNMNDEADALSNFRLAGTANDQRIECDVRGLLRPDYGSEDKGRKFLEERTSSR